MLNSCKAIVIGLLMLLIVTLILAIPQKCPFSGIHMSNDINDYLTGESNHAPVVINISDLDGLSFEKRRQHGVNSIDRHTPAIGAPGHEVTKFLQTFFDRNSNEQKDGSNVALGKPTVNQFQCAMPPRSCNLNSSVLFYRTLDGSCNNLINPDFGISNFRYNRVLPPRYSDGIHAPALSTVGGGPLPNARLLSVMLTGDETVLDELRTYVLEQFGQFIVHDMTNFAEPTDVSNCCNNPHQRQCIPITLLPQGIIASSSGKRCIEMTRGVSDADVPCPSSGRPFAEKLNKATAFIDLSMVYGSTLEDSNKLRLFTGGLLKISLLNNRQWPPVQSNVDGECEEGHSQCFNIPDKRNGFIPTITVVHTIFLREHNRLATALAHLNPHFSDEQLFQEARKINIAQMQKITYYDWLPLNIGTALAQANNIIPNGEDTLDGYVNDYDAHTNPGILASFAAGAFRYAHNQIPGWFSLIDANHVVNRTLRLSDFFGRRSNIDFLSQTNIIDSLIRGICTQPQKRSDHNIDKEIKQYFDRKEFEDMGVDLRAIDIQRDRDFGLASYNDFRQLCGLPRARTWPEFAPQISEQAISLLSRLYASPDDVDMSVGGALEAHPAESTFGPTFQCILAKQFLRVRIGDRFYFERNDPNTGFTPEQLTEIRKTTLASLFCNNADDLQHIQPNVFVLPNERNPLTNCRNIPTLDLSKWRAIRN